MEMNNFIRISLFSFIVLGLFSSSVFAVDIGNVSNSFGNKMQSYASKLNGVLSTSNISSLFVLEVAVWFFIISAYRSKIFWLAFLSGLFMLLMYNGIIGVGH